MIMYSEKVNEIIHRERKRLDSIANQWAKGFITEANNEMYQLFIDNGYKTDCEDTKQLFDFVAALIDNTVNSDAELWKEVMSHPEYEVTIDGSIRRKDTKKPIKIYPNDRVKLTKDGNVETIKIWDLVYENWYKNNNVKEVNMEDFEYVDMSSDIDPMDYNDMRFCGTTETQL